jgi:predicted GIY-YIG superfamily endonuclease
MFWVYILGNPKGTLYVGQTSDLPEKPLALMTWLN